MFEHDLTLEEAIRFSRFDEEHFLSTVSIHSFDLEDYQWPTAEHYYQAHKYEDKPYAQIILSAATGQQAHQLGNRWFKRKVSDWKTKRRVWMTRALYRKTMEHQDIKQALLETENALLIETSLYDHYWGIGRDQRGENILGKVWMDIRQKINEKE
ncbi:MAG: NADAR family protein [Cellvibrionaceae bacterium]